MRQQTNLNVIRLEAYNKIKGETRRLNDFRFMRLIRSQTNFAKVSHLKLKFSDIKGVVNFRLDVLEYYVVT